MSRRSARATPRAVAKPPVEPSPAHANQTATAVAAPNGSHVSRRQGEEPTSPAKERRGELEHRERQIEAIRRISQALFTHLTVDDMVRDILGVATEVLRADVGSLQLYDPPRDALVFRYVQNPADAERLIGCATPVSKGIAGRVFRTGVSDLTNNASEHSEFNPDIDRLTGYETRSMLTVPLKRFEGQPIGIIQVLNARTQFDQFDLEVLEVLCAYAATSIETARLVQEARRAEIVNLIGDISHDIKNMMTPIKSGVWTLESILIDCFDAVNAVCSRCPATEEWGPEILEIIYKARPEWSWVLTSAVAATDKVEGRTREIADTIKGECAPPQFQEADLNDTVYDVATALKLVARTCRVDLRLDLDAALPVARLDPQQMFNAIYNLVNNAIAATPRGGTVTLRTWVPKTDESYICFQVEDTGKGMPERVRTRLFTDAAVSTKPGGTGLGTRIVAGVIQRHNGTIRVDSQEQRGTTFTIHLPLHQPVGSP